MTPEEKAVIEAAIRWRDDQRMTVGNSAVDYGLEGAVNALEAAQAAASNGRITDHAFQPHHLAGSGVEPYTDYCVEAVLMSVTATVTATTKLWRACSRPRAEHQR